MKKQSYKKYYKFNEFVYLIFEHFKDQTINLTIKNNFFVEEEQYQYVFYFDFNKNKNEKDTYKKMMNLLNQLKKQDRTKKDFENVITFFKNEFNYKLNIDELI